MESFLMAGVHHWTAAGDDPEEFGAENCERTMLARVRLARGRGARESDAMSRISVSPMASADNGWLEKSGPLGYLLLSGQISGIAASAASGGNELLQNCITTMRG
jgi:hypothetical protein